MKVKRLTAKQILHKAARILKTHGWIQGMSSDGTGYCLLGAINQAAFGKTDTPLRHVNLRPYQTAYDQLCKLTNGRLTIWNDDRDREFDDVLAVLRRASRGLR